MLCLFIALASGACTALIWISTFESLFTGGGIVLAIPDGVYQQVLFGIMIAFVFGIILLFLVGALIEKMTDQQTDIIQFRLLVFFGFVGAQLGLLLRGVAAAKFEVAAQLVQTEHPVIYLNKLNLPVWALAGLASGLTLAIGIVMAIAIMKGPHISRNS